MKQVPTYDTFLEKLSPWATGREDIRLMVIIGSRARTDRPVDLWSDLDLIVVTTNTDAYLSDEEWLKELGQAHITFLEGTAVGEFVERRVLFEGGLDVDFVPLPLDYIEKGWPEEILGVFGRGFKVIVDKDGLTGSLPHVAATVEKEVFQPPTEAQYLHLVNDFLYHAVWVAKKLGRGEVWTAKSCCDGMMKRQLLALTEWHAHLTSSDEVDTWHGGRFLEQWADPRMVAGLANAFAHYDRDDVWRALKGTQEVFRTLAVEVAEKLNYTYPMAADVYVAELITTYQRG
jgi:aminoglycoside 6-adenylyltransferase